jgi:hypothetical protein
LIGLSAGLYLLFNGRVTGISGMASVALGLSRAGSRLLSTLFLVGLVIGTLIATEWLRRPSIQMTSSLALLVLGGLLVGYGTRLGAGCTSGHGVCGLAHLSPRSLAATGTFMVMAGITVFLMRHAFGAAS